MSRQQKVKTKLTLANGRTSSSSPPKEHCNINFKFVSPFSLGKGDREGEGASWIHLNNINDRLNHYFHCLAPFEISITWKYTTFQV